MTSRSNFAALAAALLFAGGAVAEQASAVPDAPIVLAQNAGGNTPSTAGGSNTSGTANSGAAPSTARASGNGSQTGSAGSATSGTGQNSAGRQGISGASSTGSGNAPR